MQATSIAAAQARFFRMLHPRNEQLDDANAVPASSTWSTAEASAEAGLGVRRSLRTKAWIATLAMLVYVIASFVYIAHERSRIQDSVESLETLSSHAKALALAAAALDGAIVDVNEASSAGSDQPMHLSELAQYMETCERLFQSLAPFDPAYERLLRGIVRSYEALKAQPVRAQWIDLRETMARVASDLDIRDRTLNAKRDELMQKFQRHYDGVTTQSLALALVGVAGFGTLIAWFFTHLTRDLERLQRHARTIVSGTRGPALETTRDDELGSLMRAVDRMSVELEDQKQQIEIDHQRHAHQDKMSAVGALAAGVAHEINNPLAIIAGVAQELKTASATNAPGELEERARMILLQTDRASQAARHLAELAQPQAAAKDWVDLNTIVNRAVNLMRYDKRYRQMRFECLLARDVPAIHASGDALQHAVMRMLSLAADAAVRTGASSCHAQVSTRADDDRHARVQTEFPTTLDFQDVEVQRALLLIRSVVESMRGRLSVQQDTREPVLSLTLELPSDTPQQQPR
jgi:two-component system NtrC family sensor kinase